MIFTALYSVALAGILYARGWSFVGRAMTVNLAASLAILLTMDMGLASADHARAGVMAVDAITAGVLVAKPGYARLMAALFAVNGAIVTAHLAFGYSQDTTFAITWLVNVLQLGVLAFGSSNNGGGGSRIRHTRFDGGLSPQGRVNGLSAQSMAGNHAGQSR